MHRTKKPPDVRPRPSSGGSRFRDLRRFARLLRGNLPPNPITPTAIRGPLFRRRVAISIVGFAVHDERAADDVVQFDARSLDAHRRDPLIVGVDVLQVAAVPLLRVEAAVLVPFGLSWPPADVPSGLRRSPNA